MWFKTCFERDEIFKTIQQILKYLSLQQGPWRRQTILLGCLAAASTRTAGQWQRIFSMQNWGTYSLLFSKYDQPLLFKNYRLNFNLRIQYHESQCEVLCRNYFQSYKTVILKFVLGLHCSTGSAGCAAAIRSLPSWVVGDRYLITCAIYHICCIALHAIYHVKRAWISED